LRWHNTCELHGKVLYMHSGGGFGIFGMGVLFEEMGAEQHPQSTRGCVELAGRQGKELGTTPHSNHSLNRANAQVPQVGDFGV